MRLKHSKGNIPNCPTLGTGSWPCSRNHFVRAAANGITAGCEGSAKRACHDGHGICRPRCGPSRPRILAAAECGRRRQWPYSGAPLATCHTNAESACGYKSSLNVGNPICSRSIRWLGECLCIPPRLARTSSSAAGRVGVEHTVGMARLGPAMWSLGDRTTSRGRKLT